MRASLAWFGSLMFVLGAGACGGDSSGGGGGSGATGGAGTAGTAGSAGAGPGGTAGSGPGGTAGAGGSFETDKLDLLIMVDNSASMADKQEILRSAVPDLLNGVFEKYGDVHVGVVTSSLGGHGSDSCSPASGNWNSTQNDGGRFVARDGSGGPVPTYRDLGFLAWDPGQVGVPPGDPNASNVIATFQTMVLGAGETGCGFEASLEAWYRFLVEPSPYLDLARVPCSASDTTNGCVAPTGVDEALLAQRAEFLRPDSILVIAMLTDENDCSVIDDRQFYIAVQQSQSGSQFHLPRASSTCVTNPDDTCCRSCGEVPSAGCPANDADPVCSVAPYYDTASNEDQINLRCFDQKRRFGLDFLHPIDRYVAGLASPTIRMDHDDEAGATLAPNPIYSGSGVVRTPAMVRLGTIVGVPWQLVGDDSGGSYELYPSQELASRGVWDQMIGPCPEAEVGGQCCKTGSIVPGENRCPLDDRQVRLPPGEPLMVETFLERTGSGVAGPLAPSSASFGSNPANGHEWNISQRDDLQYACVFPLASPRDCSAAVGSCDCAPFSPGPDELRKPVCQDAGGGYSTMQTSAKAYPGLRHLSVVKALGPQGVVSSICARNVTDASANDFGYRPFVRALLRTL